MKSFDVPIFYRSPVIAGIKGFLKTNDPLRQYNFPAVIDFGKVRFIIARHFGFCYGVENAIEIAFRAIAENPGKRIFLISQMIHNPEVNKDLLDRGVQFLQDTHGNQLIPFDEVNPNDIVLIPAFGAPVGLLKYLNEKGISTEKYDTTCPFVERVWKKSEQLGSGDHTIIIHGKFDHEETRSTFSRSELHSRAVVVVKDMNESKALARFVNGDGTQEEFEKEFSNKYSSGFNISSHFQKIGVINQTTMLASETEEISSYFKKLMEEKYGKDKIKEHFADTRDTLCYATNENQDAVKGLLETKADLAIVVGGYNSSNTSHLVELLEGKFPTYYISSHKEIKENGHIDHFDLHTKSMHHTKDFMGQNDPLTVVLTSGASCPDSLLEDVIDKITQLRRCEVTKEEALKFLSIYRK